MTLGNVLGDQDVSHKNGVKWSVTKKGGFAACPPAFTHRLAVEVLKKENFSSMALTGSNEAIICKSSQLYRVGNDMDVFGVRFGHAVLVE